VRSSKEGDWWVTTPVYVGAGSAVAGMAACAHVSYKTENAETKDSPRGKIELAFERCPSCGATRMRYRFLDPKENEQP